MSGTRKLSVEKARNKIRAADAPKSHSRQRDAKTEALQEEIKRAATASRAAQAQ